MSARTPSNSIAWTFLVGIGIVLIAAVLGLWIGAWFAPSGDQVKQNPWNPVMADSGKPNEPATSRLVTPFFLSTSLLSGADIEAVVGEVRLASLAGLHQYVLRVVLPWPSSSGAPDLSLAAIDRVMQTDPDAEILLSVSLNPPDAWLSSHQGAAAKTGIQSPPMPSVDSEEWKTETKKALGALQKGIEEKTWGSHISGYVLNALSEGRWVHTGDYDRSHVATAGFRKWLHSQYVDELALRTAWEGPDVTFDSATIPDKPQTDDATNVFFAIPHEQRNVDYLRYLSESTQDSIALFAAFVRQTAKRPILVLAPYGFSFEYLNNDSGHNALGLLLDGAVDGCVSPVSYSDRGLGGVGGFMAPVNSARCHGKLWFVLDDTRTGISRNPVNGAIERIEGLRNEDVQRVQQRNYASALSNGLGIMWDDAQGVGALHDGTMWEMFRQMRNTYDSIWRNNEWNKTNPIIYSNPEKKLTLAVVVDEASRFYQRCDVKLNEYLLANTRDCALRTGVPTQFLLLQDVLSGKGPPASVYLFLNTFSLHSDDRNHLHDILIAQRSSAIWMYAPGYIDRSPSVENIVATTGHHVRLFDKPTRSGSEWELSGGRWVEKGAGFGVPDEWSPLFYIETEDTKIMARYRDSKMVSIAAEFFPEGWGSIFVAEPALTPEVLREILLILEKHVFERPAANKYSDVVYFGPNLMAIHAANSGERSFDLGSTFNVQDLLDPQVGWQNKRFLQVPMRQGDTRVLSLTLSEGAEQLPQANVEDTNLPEPKPSEPATDGAPSSGAGLEVKGAAETQPPAGSSSKSDSPPGASPAVPPAAAPSAAASPVAAKPGTKK